MRGIIRYLSRRKRLKVRAYFQPLMAPSVSSLSSLVTTPPFFFFFSRPLPSPLLFVRRLGVPPMQAFLTPNLLSFISAWRKSLEVDLLLEAVQDPLSLSAGASLASH